MRSTINRQHAAVLALNDQIDENRRLKEVRERGKFRVQTYTYQMILESGPLGVTLVENGGQVKQRWGVIQQEFD